MRYLFFALNLLFLFPAVFPYGYCKASVSRISSRTLIIPNPNKLQTTGLDSIVHTPSLFRAASGKGSIEGKLTIDDSWERIVYLSLIPDFNKIHSISSDMIIDKAMLDDEGRFLFSTQYLPEDLHMYRVHIVKKGDPVATLIIGGSDENHICFLATKTSNVFIGNGTERLFQPSSVKGFKANRMLDRIHKIQALDDSVYYMQSLVKREMVDKAIDEQLRIIADTCQNPLVSLYALYKSDFEEHLSTNPGFYEAYLDKWKEEKSSYFDAFRKQVPKRKKDYSFYLFALACTLCFGAGMVFARRWPRKPTHKPTNRKLETLSVQERKIFSLLLEGKSNKELSDELNIGLSTVKSHVSSIYTKLGVKSRREVMNMEL